MLSIAACSDASLGGNSADAIETEGEHGAGFKYKTVEPRSWAGSPARDTSVTHNLDRRALAAIADALRGY